LPHLGDGAELSLSQERALGDSIITSLYRDPDYLDDAPLHAYVMQIWQPLVQAALQRGDLSEELYQRFAWQVLLGRDRSINAFALPGGYLGVHTGLIGAVTHRDDWPRCWRTNSATSPSATLPACLPRKKRTSPC